MDPESFAVENVNDLLPERGKTKTRRFLRVGACGDRGQMVEHERETAVRPGMESPNAVNSKQLSLFRISILWDLGDFQTSCAGKSEYIHVSSVAK